ncbi:hypothetical protein DFJ73DRAFT_8819 [Zopfochytrium polystomum]|nr:hypothetical protein DFJ73DRAFT_8819 [Zopfochytrium polystomum]
MAPTLAFHATPTRAALASIIDTGLVAAGDIIDETGEIVSPHFGARLGNGVYVSPDFDVSEWYGPQHYGEIDPRSPRDHQQMLVIVTLLGRCRVIREDEIGHLANTALTEADSRFWPTGRQFVLHDGSLCLPLLVITHAPSKAGQGLGEFLNAESRRTAQLLSQQAALTEAKRPKPWQEVAKVQDEDLPVNRRDFPTITLRTIAGSSLFYGSIDEDSLRRAVLFARSNGSYHVPHLTTEVRMTIALSLRSKDVRQRSLEALVMPSIVTLMRGLGIGQVDAVRIAPDGAVEVAPSCDVACFEREARRLSYARSARAADDEPSAVPWRKGPVADPVAGGGDLVDLVTAVVERVLKIQEEWLRSVENDALEAAVAEKQKEEEFQLRAGGKPRGNGTDQGADQGTRSPLKSDTSITKNLARERHLQRELVHAIVLFTDRVSDTLSMEALEVKLAKLSKQLIGAEVKVVVKLVAIGSKVNPTIPVKVKVALETWNAWEQTPIFYCRKIPMIVYNLGEELDRALLPTSLKLWADTRGVPYSGFISRLTNIPRTELTLPLPTPTTPAGFLYQGRAPDMICIDRWLYLRICIEELEDAPAPLIDLCARLALGVKVAVMARGDGLLPLVKSSDGPSDSPLDKLRSLVDSVARLAVKVGAEGESMQVSKERRRKLTSLGTFMNGLEIEARESVGRMTMEEAVQWMKPLRAMRFARQAAVRAETRATEEVMQQSMKDIEAWLSAHGNEENVGPSSELSGLTALEMLQSAARVRTQSRSKEWDTALKDWRVSDYLYSVGTVGVAASLFRSEAAAVNPWLIAATRISTRRVDTSGMLCLLHAGAEWKDQDEGVSMQDTVALANPLTEAPEVFMKTAIYASQLSVAFTRNPDVIVHGQHVALLSVAFVRTVEHLFERRHGRTHTRSPSSTTTKDLSIEKGNDRRRGYVALALDLAFTLRRLFGHMSDDWTSWLQCLRSAKPGQFLTEAPITDGKISCQGLPSVAKALVAFACMAASPGPNKTSSSTAAKSWRQFMASDSPNDGASRREMALALFAEAVSRGCRVLLKSDPRCRSDVSFTMEDARRDAIRQALGIKPNPPDSDAAENSSIYNLTAGRKYSGRFFADPRWRTNASPQAVAACLAWSRFFAHEQRAAPDGVDESLEEILRDGGKRRRLEERLFEFANADGGMPEFLARYGVGSSDERRGDPVSLQTLKDQLQTALYVQGLRHPDSSTRRNGLPSLSDPDAAIRAVAAEERQLMREDALARAAKEAKGRSAEEKKAVRVAQQQLRQDRFLSAHGPNCYPKMFNHAEIAAMNRLRPADDQLELMPLTGLLRHHCCFTKCDQFLVNQATPHDRAFGRRNGLARHMKHYFTPVRRRTYKQGMHLRVVGHLARHPGASLEALKHVARTALAAERKRTARLVVADDDEDREDEVDLMQLVEDIYRQTRRTVAEGGRVSN